MRILTESGEFDVILSFDSGEPGLLLHSMGTNVVDVIEEAFSDIDNSVTDLPEISNIQIVCERDYYGDFNDGTVVPW